MTTPWIRIHIATQTLTFFDGAGLSQTYPVSTGKNGTGEQYGSEKTPRGWHRIYAKIGQDAPLNTVFIERKPTGEIYDEALRALHPQRDWILTRILQLQGLEPGKNQGGEVDSLHRRIYIHGCPDTVVLQTPNSRGCIRMHNTDIIKLFECVDENTRVLIEE